MDWAIVALSGVLGGMLNAVAGGGSFITLPALIYVGVPPVAANATGTTALLPGYVASAWRFRRDIELPANTGFFGIMLLAAVGGCVGAVILLISSQRLFSSLIPWLILFATIAFVAGPQLVRSGSSSTAEPEEASRPRSANRYRNAAILLAVCIYGGYFNGGLGIILLAVLGLMGQTNLNGMNGLKNVLSTVLTAVAVLIYAVGHTISLKYLPLLGVSAVAGGYLGAAFAYRIPQKYLRYFVVVVGCCLTVAFFIKDL